MLNTIKIASRNSSLAIKQSEIVKNSLQQLYPNMEIKIIGFTTKGDQILDTPLAKIGGKGLFIKELEMAILKGQVDIAVHSMKDIPPALHNDLTISAILKRADPRDAFVSVKYRSLEDLPANAIVGTSSLRRQCQILMIRPDIQIKTLRGNVNTRLKKLDAGEYDAIILASAGLERLGLQHRITDYLENTTILPAVGQGAIGIESSINNQELIKLLLPLTDKNTTTCLLAERAMNRELNGSCQTPIAGLATITSKKQLQLKGLVGIPDGSKIITHTENGSIEDAEIIGTKVAKSLIKQGADSIIDNSRII